jgi:hypothetical protein
MRSKTPGRTFVEQIKEQLFCLRDPRYRYRALRVYLAGAAEPWEFGGKDEFEFHPDSGVLIVRDGPSDASVYNNAEVPEYVFRLDALVASQLV